MDRRALRPAAAAIALCAALAGVSLAQNGSPAPYPSAEEVADRGFAVWPEDTVDEARAACDSRAAEESWRLTPDGVAAEFAVAVMNHDEARIDYEMSDIGDTEARIWLYPPRELATIVSLEKAGDCWYVTFVDHRETTSSGFVYTFDGEALTAHLYDSRTKELGFADEDRRKSEGDVLRWRLAEDVTDAGHYLAIGFNRAGIGTIAAGDSLPPPPTPRSGDVVFPPSPGPVWDGIRAGKVSRCRYQPEAGKDPERVVNDMLMWEFSRAMPDGPYPDVLHRGEDGPIGKRVERYRKSNSRWLLVVDGLRLGVRMKRVMEGCWAVQRIDALNRRPILGRVWVEGDQATVKVRSRWRSAGVRLLYGTEGVHLGVRTRLGVSVTDGDIGSVDETGFDDEDPGLVSAFVTRKGRYVNAQLRRLPPLGP